MNEIGHVLLVRHSYHHSTSWFLPGGGIKRGESAEQAAERELVEETGCSARSLQLLGIYENRGEAARNQITAFVAHVKGNIAIDQVEIEEAAFFAPDDLPASIGPATRRRIAEWQGKKPIQTDW